MDLLHPLALVGLPPLIWLIYRSGRQRLRRLPWLRAVTTLLLRLAIIGLLILALAGPRISRAAGNVYVVFVLDQSASIEPSEHQVATQWIRSALQGMRRDDSASLVTFGSAPRWLGMVTKGQLPLMPDQQGDGTNIEAALRLALSTAPTDQPARMVLLSDGRQTQGDARIIAQQAAALGVPISVVPLATASSDVAVTALDLPQYARSNEHITLRIGLHTAHATTVEVRIFGDGVLLDQQAVAMNAGLTTFFFAQNAGAAGIHTYRVEARAPNDPVPQNNALDAVTVVGPIPQVLLLTTDSREAAPLAANLRATLLRVTIMPASSAPTNAAAIEAYDAVGLVDVPATALSTGTVTALRLAVHDRGHGLLVIGGPHSFAAGSYPNSGLEDLLPLTSVAVAHAGRGQVGLILIVDKSGSMMDQIHSVSKISMAQQAAIDAVAHLRSTDEFGVLAFDDSTHIIVPYGPAGDRIYQAHTRAAIMQVEAFGDTVIYPALRQAARWLFNSKAQFKHIVLLTDGQGETAPFLKLIRQMRQNNITLSTIGIGSDAEVEELRSFASSGGGRFYFTADPHDIPRLVVLETRISGGPTRVEGIIGLHQNLNAPMLRSLSGRRLPSLGGYNITAPRDNAQVLIQSQLGDPILSQWQYGLGRVVAWTGGSTPDWAKAWLQERSFWADAVRWTMPEAGPQDLRPELRLANGVLQIAADAYTPQGQFANLLATRAIVTSPTGQSQTVTLLQNAPGQYSATVPATAPGVYTVRLAQYDGTTVLQQSVSAIAKPYPEEYVPSEPDTGLLAAIAAAGNAPSLGRPADAFSNAGLPPHPLHRAIWPFLALLALLLFPLDVAVRVLYTPPAPYDPQRHGL